MSRRSYVAVVPSIARIAILVAASVASAPHLGCESAGERPAMARERPLDERSPRPERRPFIVGRVVDTGVGVSDAVVELVWDASPVISIAEEAEVCASTATSADGGFLFPDSTRGLRRLFDSERYVIRVAHRAFSSERVGPVEPRDDKACDVTVVMKSPTNSGVGATPGAVPARPVRDPSGDCRIAGRCIDAVTGVPVDAFSVSLARTADDAFPPSFNQRVFGPPTSTDGRFELLDVQEGTHVLVAKAPGYAGGRSDPITIERGERRNDVVVRIRRGAVLQGRIVDAQGRPLRNVEVRLDRAAPWEPGSFMAFMVNAGLRRGFLTSHTTEQGTYEFLNVLDGRYLLGVQHPPFAPFESTKAIEIPSTGMVRAPDVVLVPGGTIRGTVVDWEWRAVPRALVQVAPLDGNFLANRQTTTDVDGNYEFSLLPPGDYYVGAPFRCGPMSAETLVWLMTKKDAPTKPLTVASGQVVESEVYCGPPRPPWRIPPRRRKRLRHADDRGCRRTSRPRHRRRGPNGRGRFLIRAADAGTSTSSSTRGD